MTEGDELPSWTGGPQQGQRPINTTDQQQPSRRGRTVLAALAGLAVLIGMGAIGYAFAQRQAENETATEGAEEIAGPATDEDSSSEDDQLESADASAEDSTLNVDVDESTSDDDAESDSQTEEDAAGADSDDAASDSEDSEGDSDSSSDSNGDDNSTRTAVFRGGKVYLGGKVPSQEIADIIEGKAAAVLGPDNVVVEYEIDPTVTIDPGESTPLFVEDVVLFRFNSVSIDPPFLPLLDIGAALLLQNPQASLTVVTRTDAVGSEEINLDVATRRADAVVAYLSRRGVNVDQLQTDPRGEEGSSEDDDEQTAALQRRAEFVITGLLD